MNYREAPPVWVETDLPDFDTDIQPEAPPHWIDGAVMPGQPLHATISPRLVLHYQRQLLRLTREQERRGRPNREARMVAYRKVGAELRLLAEPTRSEVIRALQLLE